MNFKKLITIFLVFILLSIINPTLVSASTHITFEDNFNDGNANGWWLGYSQHTPFIDGNWRVEDIGLPHNGILVQDAGGDHFIALAEGIVSSDQTVETEISLNAHGSYGGVTLWFHDDANWVDVLLYPARGIIDVLEQQSGIQTSNIYSFPSNTNTWYKIKAVARGTVGEIDVYVNDVYLFTHTAVTTYRNGLSGVNNGNAGAYFDNFTITSTLIPTTTLIANPTSGHPGNKLTLTGNGYKPNTTIYLVWDENTVFIPTKKTTANGNINVSFVIPAGATIGTHSLRVVVNGVSSPIVNIQII